MQPMEEARTPAAQAELTTAPWASNARKLLWHLACFSYKYRQAKELSLPFIISFPLLPYQTDMRSAQQERCGLLTAASHTSTHHPEQMQHLSSCLHPYQCRRGAVNLCRLTDTCASKFKDHSRCNNPLGFELVE